MQSTIRAHRPSIFEERKRGCTDWPCLIIFIVFLIVYILFIIFVFRQGSIYRFISPTDSQGRICGIESEKNRKFLQFFDIVKCVKYVLIGARCPTPQMCVDQCPKRFYHYKILYAQELRLNNKTDENLKKIRSKLSCEKSARSQVENRQLTIYTLVKERKLCAPYAFPSTSLYGRCIPSVLVSSLNTTIQQANEVIRNQGGKTDDEDPIPTKDSIQMSFEYFQKALQIKRILSFMIDDLIQSRRILLLSFLFGMFLVVIYMIFLRFLARLIIWLSLILCIVVFALAATFCFTAYVRIKMISKTNSSMPNLHEMNVTFDENELNNSQSRRIDEDLLTNQIPSTIEKFDQAMIFFNEFTSMSTIWLVLGLVCCILCVLLMICTCCLCDRLRLAAALIEEASKGLCHALSVLIWPIITFLVNIGLVILGVLVLAYFSTLGRPIYQISCSQDFGRSCRTASSRLFVTENETNPMKTSRSTPKTCFDYNEGDHCFPDDFARLNCSDDRIRCVYVSFGFPDQTFQDYFDPVWSHRFAEFLSEKSWLINIFNIFMIYWLIAFTIAFEEMVLACTFASYYWSMYQMDQQCCRGYFHRCLCLEGVSVTFRHHLGTIAFGSSIIAIIDTLRTLIDLIKDRMEGLNLTQYGKCCLNIIRATLTCVRCCFQFLSRYTYIMTAVSGKWFCPAAFTATRLLLNNCLRIFVLDRVCALLLFIGRITITIGSCVFAAFLLDRVETSIQLHFSWFPVLIIGITVYVSSAIFLNVYSLATSTLFFCVLYDLEIHDGHQIESTVMSYRLKKILGQSKDFSKQKFTVENHSTSTDQTQSRF